MKKAKYFTVGPVQMYLDIFENIDYQLPYFRTDEFSNITLSIKGKMMELVNCDGDVAIITSSGTGGLEAAILNTINKNDKCLVVNGGTFGARFVQLTKLYNANFDEIQLKFNETLDSKRLSLFENKGYTKFFVQACETSTGQLYDLNLISDFCKRNNIMLIVDAISSFLADPIDMIKQSIDLLIISSQKELAIDPGLCLILVSKRMKKEISNNDVKSLYFNLNNYFINMERGQPPFTPAIRQIMELKNRLENINLQDEIKNCETKAKYFRQEICKLGFEIPSVPLSNGLTPVITKNNNAYKLFLNLKEKGYVVNPNGGELKNKVFRVSHMGNTTISDIDDLIIAIKEESNI